MKAEITRKDSCKGEMSNGEWLLKGRSRVGELTTDHAASSYGQPVAVVSEWGGLLNYSDIKSIDLFDATNEELADAQEKLAPFGIKVGHYGKSA